MALSLSLSLSLSLRWKNRNLKFRGEKLSDRGRRQSNAIDLNAETSQFRSANRGFIVLSL